MVSNPQKPAISRKVAILTIIIVLMTLSLIAETTIIIEQKSVNQAIEKESAAAFNAFSKKGITAGQRRGTDILMRNVRFCWSRAVCVNSRQLTATAEPSGHLTDLNFDNLNGFIINVHNATTFISPTTLQGMFNESVFNYPDSKLRNLTVSIDQAAGHNRVKLRGSLKHFIWIPFEMDTVLKVDHTANTLVISVLNLKVFGFIPAKWLIDLKPFNLEKLLTLPANQHLIVRHNLMMVKPFGLFPPPHISGTIESVEVLPQWIELQFSGQDPAFQHIPQPGAGNYIYLQGGSDQFGRVSMVNTQIQVIDRNPINLFQFSLLGYLNYLPISTITMTKDGSIVVQMPDHQHIPTMAPAHLSEASGGPGATIKPPPSKPKRFLEHVHEKLKEWFGI